jgi:EAL domain-containing protein (putative c-di-GMP-specific phosphodiesterase class I)
MGKSLQPLNAMAVRPPINTPAASANAGSEPVTAESLGWQLRGALPPLRLHSVSLYDDQANVLWLSEGALGPDEHNLVLEAIETLSNDRSLPCYENGLEDGRVAIFLPVRAPQGDLVGVAMILADLKSVSDGILEKIVSPQVRTIMQKIAVLLRAAVARVGNGDPPAPIPVAIAPVLELTPERTSAAARPVAPVAQLATPPTASAQPAPVKPAAPAPQMAAANTKQKPTPATAAAPMVAAAPVVSDPVAQAGAPAQQSLSPQAIDDILEFELYPNEAAAAAAEELVPMSPASTFQPTESLAWDPTGAQRMLEPEPLPAVAFEPEPANPPAVVAPARAAGPAKPLAQPSQASTPNVVAPTPAAAPAPVLAPVSLATSAPATQAHSPAPVIAPVATPIAPATAPLTSDSPPAAAATPTLTNANPTVAAPPVPKTTGATTTSRALNPSATTGTARTLNGSGATTNTVQALNAGGTTTGTSRTIAFDPSNLILDVQPFSKLRAGGRMRRYEVLPRVPHRDANRAPATMDGLALQRLLSWLGSNRSAWNLEPTSFSLNLSISTLEDERFPQHVASCLKANGIAPDNLGFEIAEPLCTQRRAQVERFISLCDKLGCFVIIDDFSFDSTVLPLLRSKALRLVKIDPRLTSAALRDKLSQAMVVAIVQAVKVLGIHCAAKRVESQASLQWLTAIGCDLAQGPALSQVLPIESLNMPQNATEGGKAS